MTISIEEETTVTFDFDYNKLSEDVINFTIDHEQFPFEAEVNLFLVDEERIQEINRDYRKLDKSTDVLSFPMLEYTHPGAFDEIDENVDDNFNPDTGEALLGDIIICINKVKEQAESYGHSEKREFAFLLVHSMLHLFGYDHMTEEEAAIMINKQKGILNEMNILR